MKRLQFALLSLLALTACGGPSTVSYRLDMDVTGTTQVQELTEASFRVIERRLDSMGATVEDKNIVRDGSGTLITVTTGNKETTDALTSQLTQPFDLQIMAEAGEGVTPDITVEGHGGFVLTGITGDDLAWVLGRQVPGQEIGEVQLQFTNAGRAKMNGLFETMQGKNIGLFVRGQLVSKLAVEAGAMDQALMISGIPTPELAGIFADDVNVGTHVTFTPIP